jgi:FHS family glucose/mannose:H+ symporter-like MFS transporter
MEKNHKGAALAAAFIGIFFFGMAFLVLGAVLPSLKEALNLTDSQVSTLTSLLPFGVLLGSLVFGPVIDRYGYKILLVSATAFGVAGLELFAFSSGMAGLIAGVVLIGLCGGMLNGSTNALVSDISEDKSRTSNLFILGLVYCLGAFTIPLLMASASKTFDYHAIVSFSGYVMAASLIFYLFVRFPEAKCKQGIPLKEVGKMFKEPVLIILSFVLFFESAIEGLANNWTSTYLVSKSFSIEMAAYALSFVLVGLAISRVVLTFVSRVADGKVIIICSMLLEAVGAALVMIASSQAMAIAGAMLLGMGQAAGFPVVFGIVGKKYSRMSGTAFSFALVIALIGNMLLNKLVGSVGVRFLPWVIICSTVALSALFLVGSRKAAVSE